MRVVVAPDSWSGFAPALSVARTVADALSPAGLRPTLVPMADGGEGTSLVLLSAGASPLPGVLVRGPEDQRVRAPVCDLNGVTFVESARVIGLGLVHGEGSALDRSSYGLGEALTLAGVNREGPLVVGLGGSATLDGGLGMAQALGLRLEDAQGRTLSGVPSARALSRVDRLHGDPPLAFQIVQGWADVRTPLVDSATQFGAQKGATAPEIAAVTDGLSRWADVVNTWRQELGQREVPRDVVSGGAAGGLGFALVGLLDARLVSGARAVARAVGLPRALRGAGAVVTGEGRYDPTSLDGKVVGEVLALARAAGVPQVGVLAGSATTGSPPPEAGPDWVVTCAPGDEQGRQERLEDAAAQVARRLSSG